MLSCEPTTTTNTSTLTNNKFHLTLSLPQHSADKNYNKSENLLECGMHIGYRVMLSLEKSIYNNDDTNTHNKKKALPTTNTHLLPHRTLADKPNVINHTTQLSSSIMNYAQGAGCYDQDLEAYGIGSTQTYPITINNNNNK